MPHTLFINQEYAHQLLMFVSERIALWEKKTCGATPPYTQDPILAQYRFCNILRELDRQTIEYHTLLNPLRDNFPLWLMNMYFCRLVARPETIRTVGLLSFKPERNRGVYEKLCALPAPRYGTPYVFPVSTILKSPTPTRETLVTLHLPQVIHRVASHIETLERASVADELKEVCTRFGFTHSFLWTEVLIDVAYQFPRHIDLFKRFPVGPGALPTLKQINAQTHPELLTEKLGSCRFPTPFTVDGKTVVLSAENWEGIACEFRKYSNLREGSGRKRLYRPKEKGGGEPLTLF